MASAGPIAAVLLLAALATAGTVVLVTRWGTDRGDHRDGFVDLLEAPAVVVGSDDRILDLDLEPPGPFDGDPTGPLDLDEAAMVDEPVDRVFSAYPALRSALAAPEPSTVVEVSTPNGQGELQVTGIPLEDTQRGEVTLFLFHEPAERSRRVRDLERQNERLDRFTSLVSHDLRNPLDVAMGRAQAVVEMNEDEDLDPHLAELVDAHERMRRIIDDGLALARQGRQIGDGEPVDLGSLAEAAWARVATADATLEVTADRVILADRNRLARVFENLFRNAVQHGGEAVTVEVGDTEEGFYVADDGVGIQPVDRERLFEPGETGSGGGGGTGLGLAIVREIAEAHGWDVAATSSDTGGARIEFDGVEAGDRDHAEEQSSFIWEPS